MSPESHAPRQRCLDRPRAALRTIASALFAGLVAGLLVPATTPAAADESITERQYLELWTNDFSGNWEIGFGDDTWSPPEPGLQLRVPSFQTRAVPAGQDFAWLGEAGEQRWHTMSATDYDWTWPIHSVFGINTFELFDDVFAEGEHHVDFSFAEVRGPGSFALYNVPLMREEGQSGPDAPNELFRWGTGTQRDGSPQGMDAVFSAPLNQRFNAELSFGASGMYCVDATSSAKLADGTLVSATRTLRFAVGEEVAADAPCGTASGEVPGTAEPAAPPALPAAPVASVAGSTATVEWQAPQASSLFPVTGYAVTLDGDGEPLVREVDADTTSATFGDLPDGFYRARVVARNAVGDSPASRHSNWIAVGDGLVRVVDEGHIDAIAPQVDADESGGQRLALRAHHDDYGWAEWDDFVLYSDDTARRTLPETYTTDRDWSFVGEPGQTTWNSPEAQRLGLPWAGLSTEDQGLRDAVPAGEKVDIRFDAVFGQGGSPAPGELIVHQEGAPVNGARITASTKQGLPRGFAVRTGSHVHYNWDFTAPGVYCIAVTVDAVLADGVRHSDRGLLTHVVGETVDPATVVPCNRESDYPETGAPPAAAPVDPVRPVLHERGFGNLSLGLGDGGLDVGFLRSDSYRISLPERYDVEDVIFRAKLEDQQSGNDGLYWFGTRRGGVEERDYNAFLAWNTLGVPADEIGGDVEWRVTGVRGPGELLVQDRSHGADLVFDTVKNVVESKLVAQTERQDTEWAVTKPGKYCIDLSWSAQTLERGEARVSKTLTVVADGEGFTHDASTLTTTCADAPAQTRTSVKFARSSAKYNAANSATVTVAAAVTATGSGSAAKPSGTVRLRIAGQGYSARLSNGKATVRLKKPIRVGSHTATATFVSAAADAFANSSVRARLRVTKAAPRVSAKLLTSRVKRSQHARVRVIATIPGSMRAKASKYRVQIFDGKKRIRTQRLNGSGKATVRLPQLKRGSHKIRVKLVTTANTTAKTSRTRTLRVR